MELFELKQQFDTVAGQMKTFMESAQNELKAGSKTQSEIAERIDKMQTQLDAIDMKMQQKRIEQENKTFSQELRENESVLKLAKDGRGTAVITIKGGLPALERKTTVTTTAVGLATSGVLNYERDPGIELQAMRRFTVRDLLPATPTTEAAIDYVKINAFTNAASMQVEASDKAESALTFTTATANVRTIAHWIPATKQILNDFDELGSVINTELVYGLKLKEESQLLSGSGSGNDLNGLITQATAFSTSLLGGAAWHKADVIRRAIQQVSIADQTEPTWIVLHPTDWADIELTKDTSRMYVSGYNGLLYTPRGPQIWNLRVVPTPSITSGSFLLGNSIKAKIRDREDVNIEISTEHSDYFVKNMVAIRCEERLALVVRRPASYITGSFTTSP